VAKLVLFLPDGSTKAITLNKERIVIGRRVDNDVCLPFPAVSGEHAAVVTILSDSFLEDLSSTNGTLVNGATVQKHFLRDRDQIDIGRQKLIYLADEAADLLPQNIRTERTDLRTFGEQVPKAVPTPRNPLVRAGSDIPVRTPRNSPLSPAPDNPRWPQQEPSGPLVRMPELDALAALNEPYPTLDEPRPSDFADVRTSTDRALERMARLRNGDPIPGNGVGNGHRNSEPDTGRGARDAEASRNPRSVPGHDAGRAPGPDTGRNPRSVPGQDNGRVSAHGTGRNPHSAPGQDNGRSMTPDTGRNPPSVPRADSFARAPETQARGPDTFAQGPDTFGQGPNTGIDPWTEANADAMRAQFPDAGRNPRSISRVDLGSVRSSDMNRDPRGGDPDAGRGRSHDADRDRHHATQPDSGRGRGAEADRNGTSHTTPVRPIHGFDDGRGAASASAGDFEGDEEFDFDVTGGGGDRAAVGGQVDTMAESLARRADAQLDNASNGRHSPARITVLSGASAGRTILVERDEVIIGRVGVQVAAVDRVDGHFRLRLREGDATPILNGDRVPTNGAKLKNGDIFEVAGARLEFLAPR
jgi:FHA domain